MVAFVIGVLFFAVYSGRVGPLIGYDLKNYHYYAGYALLEGRFDLDYAPAQIQSFLNPLSFVPFYWLASNFEPVASGVVLGGIHGIAVGLLFMMSLLMFSSLAPVSRLALSILCSVTGVYAPVFLSTVGSSHNDILVGLFVIAGVLVLIKGIVAHGSPDARGARRAVIVAGILVGIAAGLKLVYATFLIGCAVAVFVSARGVVQRLSTTGLLGAFSLLGFVASRGFWMAMLWSKFGSPLFPFYNKIFRSPYYHNRDFLDDRFLPESVETALRLPFHFLADTHFTHMSQHFRDARYAMVYVLILLYLVAQIVSWIRSVHERRKGLVRSEEVNEVSRPQDNTKRAGLFLVVFFVASYVVWQTMFAVIRYTVPMELVAPIVIAVLVRSMWRRNYARWIITILAFAAIAAIMKPLAYQRGPWHTSYFNVKAPRFDNPGETLIVMANNKPWSYVIPFFQPEVRFIGLWSTFSRRQGEGERHLATEEMLAIVRSHRGPRYLLSRGGHRVGALRNLEPNRFATTSTECLSLSEISVPTLAEARRRRAAAAGRKVVFDAPPVRLCLYPLVAEP
jgi:hypothetical protein